MLVLQVGILGELTHWEFCDLARRGQSPRRDPAPPAHTNTRLISGANRPSGGEGGAHGKDLVAPVETACEDVDDIVTLVGVLAREDVAQQREEGLHAVARDERLQVSPTWSNLNPSGRVRTCLDSVGTARVVRFRFFEGPDGMNEEERDVVLQEPCESVRGRDRDRQQRGDKREVTLYGPRRSSFESAASALSWVDLFGFKQKNSEK